MKKTKRLTDGNEGRMLLRRILVYGGAFFLICVLQSSFFSRLKPFGATPDIILGALCGVFMLDGKKEAAVCALCAGFFIDAVAYVPPSFSPLFYLLCVAVLGTVSDKMIPRFVSYAAVTVLAVVLRAVYTYLNLWFAMGAVPTASSLTSVILPEALSTFVFCLPVYFLIKLCVIPIEAKGSFSFR